MDPLGTLLPWIAAGGILGLLGVTLLERLVPILPSTALLIALARIIRVAMQIEVQSFRNEGNGLTSKEFNSFKEFKSFKPPPLHPPPPPLASAGEERGGG